MTPDEIRERFIRGWSEAARADDGAWLRKNLGQPDVNLDVLVVTMTSAFRCIEVEELDPDDPGWDPNAVLHWQTYGRDRSGEDSIAVRFHGADHVVLFGEFDAFDDSFGLEELVARCSFKRVTVEMPDRMDLDEKIEVLGYIEDGLGLTPPLPYSLEKVVLFWDENGELFEAELADVS